MAPQEIMEGGAGGDPKIMEGVQGADPEIIKV